VPPLAVPSSNFAQLLAELPEMTQLASQRQPSGELPGQLPSSGHCWRQNPFELSHAQHHSSGAPYLLLETEQQPLLLKPLQEQQRLQDTVFDQSSSESL